MGQDGQSKELRRKARREGGWPPGWMRVGGGRWGGAVRVVGSVFTFWALLDSSGLTVGPGARGAASRRPILKGRVTALGGRRVEGPKDRENSRAGAAG